MGHDHGPGQGVPLAGSVFTLLPPSVTFCTVLANELRSQAVSPPARSWS